MMLRTILIFCLFGVAFTQVPSLGPCPNVQTIDSLNVTQYLGRWYEAEKYFAIFEAGGKCITADYSPGENGTIKVVNSQVSVLTGRPSSVEGSARIPDSSEPGKLKVKLSPVPFGIEGDYWILGTDYDSYSVVYSCSNLEIVNFKFAWILTRVRNPPQAVIEEARQIAARNNVTLSDFSKTDQTNCPTI